MRILPQIGETFASVYRIDSRLGRGGHGAVFSATDLRLGNSVALKILLPEQLEEKSRFRREAELGERLTDPHSVRLIAHGEDAAGLPFIAFELLDGQALNRVLEERGAFPVQKVGEIGAAILRALGEAHELGMVHRDIKPANIQLCTYGGVPDFVKVLDFGIAKRSARDATQLTATDVAVGTARYMAPEQLQGGQISAATDLYSLGLVMAEMLTGEPVFRGSTIDVCLAQVAPTPVPLDPRVLASPLGGVIARAVQKRASERFDSARDMAAALAQVFDPFTDETKDDASPQGDFSDDTQDEPVVHDDFSDQTTVMEPNAPAALPVIPMAAPARPVPLAYPVGPSLVPLSTPPFLSPPVASRRSGSRALVVVLALVALVLFALLVGLGGWLLLGETSPSDPPPMPTR
ncbi:MAG: serine/threonine-protein kinase [Polyangiaceae bacterium]